jgi:hypothetical protein
MLELYHPMHWRLPPSRRLTPPLAPRKPSNQEQASMRILSHICLVILALGSATSASAASSTPYAKGGRTKDFAVDVELYRRSGERFRITGHCQSACTMFLALPNVCIEPSARLLFHAGNNDLGTRRMMNSYNAKLRSYLKARRIMKSPEFHTISGREMISRFGYRACGGDGD